MFLNKEIKADLYRYVGDTSFRSFIKALRAPGFRFTFLFRKVTSVKKYSPIWFFYILLYRRYFIKYGIQIPTSVTIGNGLIIPHCGGIVVNSGTVIGNNCNLLQNVTLGNTKRGRQAGSPTIGNLVYIGPGAIIVGEVTIGDNVLIAGNAFVNFNVPENSIVIGNPAKIIKKEHATEGYINRIWREI